MFLSFAFGNEAAAADQSTMSWFVLQMSFYLWAIGIIVSPGPAMAGRGASTVRTPSLLREERIDSGLTFLGSKNSRLYSL